MSEHDPANESIEQTVNLRTQFTDFAQRERRFLVFLAVAFFVAGATYDKPEIAMWVGFVLAGYSAIANDSIQTIGTFIASNFEKKWWHLWIFIGGIFLATMTYSFLSYGGPIDFAVRDVKTQHGEPANIKDLRLRATMDLGGGTFDVRELHFDVVDGEGGESQSLGVEIKKLQAVTKIEIGRALPFEGKLKKGELEPFEAVAAGEGPTVDGSVLKWQIRPLPGKTPRIGTGEVTVDKAHGGDVSHQRLFAKGFSETRNEFNFLHVAAPIFLMILTRLRMPVSTTFLLLSAFATAGKSIVSVVTKSMMGYVIAFIVAIIVWRTLGKWMQRRFTGKAHPGWRVAQWASTGTLWSVWLMQDAANIAVYLPRSMSNGEFGAFSLFIFAGLGFLFFQRGERIQQVVNEKADVIDVRPATVIDFIYALILYIFKIQSKVPMSTTWVFIGLLGGREVALAWARATADGRTVADAFRLMRKDLIYVTIGFLVSLAIAAASNDVIAKALFNF
jgi:hypothetical protein